MGKQFFSWSKRRKIALLIMISILLSCGITFWLHSPSGHVAGFYIEKTWYRMFSPYYSTNLFENDRGDSIGLRIEDRSDMKQAKAFMPELLVPGYIPEDWEMESLELLKTIQGNYYVKYSFIDKEDRITINETAMTEKERFRFYHDSQEIQLKNRKVVHCFDALTGLNSIIFSEKNLLVIIDGENEDVMLIVADNMN